MTTVQLANLTLLGEAASTEAFTTLVGSQPYVLKRLKQEQHGNRRLRRMFPILSSSASQYHYKHLARIFQVDGDSVQVLMQHFPATLATEGFKDTEDVVSVLVQSLLGLQYLHSKNTIHLNLKPTNIMREASGNVRLADPLCYSPGSTASIGINPDYRFFSPTQLDPMSAISPACDIYSLAMTIAMTINERRFRDYVKERLEDSPSKDTTSSAPLSGPHFSIKKDRLGRRPTLWSRWHRETQHANPSVGSLDKNLPTELVQVLDRMLEKDPRKRFDSADKVLECLADLNIGGPATKSLGRTRVAADTSRNWSTGIETVLLGGTAAGESHFSNQEFEIDTTGFPGFDERAVRLSPDGASWFLESSPPITVLVNHELKHGKVALQHGDVVRLGPSGPDVLIHRNETDPNRILLAAREAMVRDKERVGSVSQQVPDDPTTYSFRSKPTNASKNSLWLPILITAIAAVAVCALLYIFALGGSQ